MDKLQRQQFNILTNYIYCPSLSYSNDKVKPLVLTLRNYETFLAEHQNESELLLDVNLLTFVRTFSTIIAETISGEN